MNLCLAVTLPPMPRLNRSARTALLVCAIGVPASAAIAGCGGGLSGDSVADVDGTQISKSDFEKNEKFMQVQASQQVLGGKLFKSATPKLIVFKAPYTECVTEWKKQIPKGQKVTDQQIKDACANMSKQVKTAAMSQLLTKQIIDNEAKDEKVSVDDKEIDKQLPATLTQAIGGKENLAKFTALTGLKVDVLRDQVKNNLLGQKLQEKISKQAGKITDADVQKYYEKNKVQYTRPETRDLHVILAKTEPKAQQAKKALENGDSFATVAKKYSVDEVTKKAGGELKGVAKGQQERALENAAFKAQKGELVGPIKTETGYYVIRVDKITPAKVEPFDKVKTMIKQQLTQQKPQEAWTKWQADVTKKWKDKTECRDGYNDVPFCKNQPKPKTTTGAAPAQ